MAIGENLKVVNRKILTGNFNKIRKNHFLIYNGIM